MIFPIALKEEGKFVLPWQPEVIKPDIKENLRFSFRLDRTRIPCKEDLDDEPLVQRVKDEPEKISYVPETGVRTTWLGHASVLFQFDGVNILANPNFNSHVGLLNFAERYRQPVYSVEQMPRIDCVFITNTHFDYLDVQTIRDLDARFGDVLLWYVPMGLGAWMHKQGCASVVELDWWSEDEVDFIDYTKLSETDDEDKSTTTFKIACTPTQSGHTRKLDDAAVLWCSWVIASPRYKVFIAGSTGYHGKLFKTIGSKYGPFHMAALPIGRYCPEWKFGWGNVTPELSVQIQQDILAMCALGVSWGTVNLSNEYFLEPARRLKEELEKRGMTEVQFFLLKHGESRLIDVEKVGVEKGSEIKVRRHHHHNHHDHVHQSHTITTTTTITNENGEVKTRTETIDGNGTVVHGDEPVEEDDEKRGLIQRIVDKVKN